MALGDIPDPTQKTPLSGRAREVLEPGEVGAFGHCKCNFQKLKTRMVVTCVIKR
jgi:hypothetical protein